MRRPAFTLIELLLVISIIAVLAALLIPLIGYARNMAKNAKGKSQLGTIQAALAHFKDANGIYPEKLVKGAKDEYERVFKPSGTYKTADQLTSTDWTDIATALLEQLQTVDRDNFRDLASLRDPFTGGAALTNVFRYRPAKFYPLQAGATRLIDSDNPVNADSYQLWSAGLDGKDQFGERVNGRASDDITNWKTP